jgi:hypothetical protein
LDVGVYEFTAVAVAEEGEDSEKAAFSVVVQQHPHFLLPELLALAR